MSRRTTVRRIEAIAANLQEKLLNTAHTFKCFSNALDESTCGYSRHSTIADFHQRNWRTFCITREVLSMESLQDTTSGLDIFGSVMRDLEKSQLS